MRSECCLDRHAHEEAVDGGTAVEERPSRSHRPSGETPYNTSR